jgi:hypothetical protein
MNLQSPAMAHKQQANLTTTTRDHNASNPSTPTAAQKQNMFNKLKEPQSSSSAAAAAAGGRNLFSFGSSIGIERLHEGLTAADLDDKSILRQVRAMHLGACQNSPTEEQLMDAEETRQVKTIEEIAEMQKEAVSFLSISCLFLGV